MKLYMAPKKYDIITWNCCIAQEATRSHLAGIGGLKTKLDYESIVTPLKITYMENWNKIYNPPPIQLSLGDFNRSGGSAFMTFRMPW